MSEDTLLELALGAARDAGSLLLERFGGPVSGVESKSSATDMVSDADRAAERLVLDRISAERPDDGVVAEESGRAAGSSGLVWVVDPLDGTTNYLFSYPVWAVSIACEDADGGVVAEEQIREGDELEAARRLRAELREADPRPAAETLAERIRSSASNAELLSSL